MNATLPLPDVLARFAAMMAFLCQQILPFGGVWLERDARPGMFARPMPHAVVTLARKRLERFRREFLALAARIRAGTVRPYAPRKSSPRAPLDQPRARPDHRLPAGRGWLIRMEGHHAAGQGAYLAALLREPAMIALLAATPRMGRLLRPLCRALCVDVRLLAPPGVPALARAAGKARPAAPPREKKPTKREMVAAMRAVILERKARGLNAGEPGRPLALFGLGRLPRGCSLRKRD